MATCGYVSLIRWTAVINDNDWHASQVGINGRKARSLFLCYRSQHFLARGMIWWIKSSKYGMEEITSKLLTIQQKNFDL